MIQWKSQNIADDTVEVADSRWYRFASAASLLQEEAATSTQPSAVDTADGGRLEVAVQQNTTGSAAQPPSGPPRDQIRYSRGHRASLRDELANEFH